MHGHDHAYQIEFNAIADASMRAYFISYSTPRFILIELRASAYPKVTCNSISCERVMFREHVFGESYSFSFFIYIMPIDWHSVICTQSKHAHRIRNRSSKALLEYQNCLTHSRNRRWDTICQRIMITGTPSYLLLGSPVLT